MEGTVIITGANGGLGSAMVSQIITTHPFLHCICAVRDESNAIQLKAEIDDANTRGARKRHEVLELDLAQLIEVRKFANRINTRVSNGELPPIRALALNAGFQEHSPKSTLTSDGLDATFQINHLGHFLLTLLLLQSLDRENGRILVIGSWLHDPEDKRFNGIMIYPEAYRPILSRGIGPLARGEWGGDNNLAGRRRYGAAKLCQIIMMLELQRRLNNDPVLNRICVVGLDPGGMPSGIMRRASFFERVILNKLAGNALAPVMTWLWPNGQLRTTYKSASDALQVLVEHDSSSIKGRYFNGTERWEVSQEAKLPANRTSVWEESVSLVQLDGTETQLFEWK